MSIYGAEAREAVRNKAHRIYKVEDVLMSKGIKLSQLKTVNKRNFEGEWVEHEKRVCRRLAESVFREARRVLGTRPCAVSISGIIMKCFVQQM